jgi:hypothetical protein
MFECYFYSVGGLCIVKLLSTAVPNVYIYELYSLGPSPLYGL